ncbi:MAG: DUF721 domain-containing protein [Desulfobacterales bacterium]|nr:DUF721 domain-containing protein [Desulfobacterales bacterium]MDJ0885865.1 DUF721 domain-containing protein [Desulfobacterales bacterium]
MTDGKDKGAGMTPIEGILTRMLRQYRSELELDPERIGSIWERAVGATIARNAQPAAIKQRRLIVHVSSSVWLQELHFRKAALIESVNREAGQVVLEEIQFRIGPLKPS